MSQQFQQSTYCHQAIEKSAKLSTKWNQMVPHVHLIIALKRGPILRIAHHRVIVYCWQNNIIPETWKRLLCTHLHKSFIQTHLQPSNFRPITLEPVYAEVLTLLIWNSIYSYRVLNRNLWYNRTYRDFNLCD